VHNTSLHLHCIVSRWQRNSPNMRDMYPTLRLPRRGFAFLNFSTNATVPTTIARPTAAPVFLTDCNEPCSDITQAFSTCIVTDCSGFCSPVFASVVACEESLATVNAQNAEMLISIDIPSCFRLANPQPVTLMPNCFTSPYIIHRFKQQCFNLE
jgi:hypothetical protein